jgi:hypothetical protein
MPVRAADPDAKALDEAFETAMGAPAKPHEPEAPPDADPDAPFGRDEDGTAKAPYGLTKEGKPRRSNAGRKSKDDASRTTAAAAGGGQAAEDKGAGTAAAGHDYTVALSEFGDAVWFGASALGKGGSSIPLIGKYLPERKIAAQAAIFKSYKPSLVGAVNVAAQHNAKARRFAQSIESGDITWVVMVGFMVMPFLTMSAAIWKDSEKNPALERMDLPGIATLAGRNDKALDAYLERINAEMERMAEQQQAEALAQLAADNEGDRNDDDHLRRDPAPARRDAAHRARVLDRSPDHQRPRGGGQPRGPCRTRDPYQPLGTWITYDAGGRAAFRRAW